MVDDPDVEVREVFLAEVLVSKLKQKRRSSCATGEHVCLRNSQEWGERKQMTLESGNGLERVCVLFGKTWKTTGKF